MGNLVLAGKAPSRSATWVIADTVGTTVIAMLAMLAMARLVGPEQFGAAALAIGVVQVINLYIEGLLHDALIRDRSIGETAFDEAFWLLACLGLLLALLSALAWLMVSRTAAAPLAKLICIAALSLPFSGMTGVSNARLRREMDYKFVAAPSVAAKLLSSLVGLGLAFFGAGAWSLVLQLVVAAVVQSSGLLLLSGWRPKLRISTAALAPLWRFAFPYAVMHTLVGLRIQGFVAVAAATGGLAAAGYINVAFRLTLTPQILLATALTNVGLPLLAREQHDRPALVAAFRRFSRLTALSLPVVFFGVATCSDLIVRVMLGPRWLPSILPMQVFALGGAFYLLRLPGSLVLRALGRVRYSLLNAIMHLVVTLGIMLWLRPKNPAVVSLLWVAPLAPLMPLTLFIVRHETGLPVATQLCDVAGPIACAACMALAVLAIRPLLAGLPDVTTLTLCVGTGAMAYVGLVLLTDCEIRSASLSEVRRLLGRLGVSSF